MSLYQDIELIESYIKEIQASKQSLFNKLVHFVSLFKKEQHPDYEELTLIFLARLAANFKNILKTGNYFTVIKELNKIKEYRNNSKYLNQHAQKLLDFIEEDLNYIIYLQYRYGSHPFHPLNTHVKTKIISAKKNSFQISYFNQAQFYKLGNSKGECYGFSFAMAHPKLSIFKNKNLGFDFNQEIHDFQKHQSNRKMDQQVIKSTRISRDYLYFNVLEQAHKIFDIASQHIGKELYLSLYSNKASHACYMSIRDDLNIWFMDPNNGAYIFPDKKAFISYYITNQSKANKNAKYPKFSLSALRYDEHQVLKESKTWKGIIRTILTGPKYEDNSFVSHIFTAFAYQFLALSLSIPLLLVLCICAPSISIIVGPALICLISLLFSVLVASAGLSSYNGLLSVPHYIMHLGHMLFHKIKTPFNSKANPNSNTPEQVEPSETQNTISLGLNSANKKLTPDTHLAELTYKRVGHYSGLFSTKLVSRTIEKDGHAMNKLKINFSNPF